MASLAKLGKLLNWKWGALLGALLSISIFAWASDNSTTAPGRVPKPILEQGKGDKCVEDTEFMRRNHMKLLLHQRDQTVHEGIRTKKYSLTNCIECHASQKNNSVIGSNQNFCQSCHSYAAVKIDCFECHATKPKASAAATFHPLVAPAGASNGLAVSMREQMRGTGLAAPEQVGAK